MNNKQKLRMARRMYPKHKANVFSSHQWEARKKGIKARVEKIENIAHERGLERKKQKVVSAIGEKGPL